MGSIKTFLPTDKVGTFRKAEQLCPHFLKFCSKTYQSFVQWRLVFVFQITLQLVSLFIEQMREYTWIFLPS